MLDHFFSIYSNKYYYFTTLTVDCLHSTVEQHNRQLLTLNSRYAIAYIQSHADDVRAFIELSVYMRGFMFVLSC
jgi:hypothetical protein